MNSDMNVKGARERKSFIILPVKLMLIIIL